MSEAQDLADQINKVLGAGSVKMGSEVTIETIPTGVLPIDVLLGGGLPRGRFTEFFGDYSTLKSYVGLRAIASAQQEGGKAALVDTEGAFDPGWAASLGVDTDSLIYLSPGTMEEAVDVTEALIRAKTDVVVWDSVAASLPQVERDKREYEEKHQPARLAAAMSRATRKLNAANEVTCLMWINQTRLAIGITYGNPERTPGGRALPFYASHRVAMRKAGNVRRDVQGHDGYTGKSMKETHGIKVRATLEKSKLTKPHRDVLFTFDLETGDIDEARFLVSHGLEVGEIEKKGSKYWVTGKSTQAVVGIEKMIDRVREDQSMAKALRSIYLGNPEPDKSKDE